MVATGRKRYKKLTLKEECCLIGNQITSKVLRRIHQTGDRCPTQISALKQIKKSGGSTHLRLDLDCALHHGQGLLGRLGRSITQTLDTTQGLCLAASANEPPWRFGSQEEQNHERSLPRGKKGGGGWLARVFLWNLSHNVLKDWTSETRQAAKGDSRGKATAEREVPARPIHPFACCNYRWPLPR